MRTIRIFSSGVLGTLEAFFMPSYRARSFACLCLVLAACGEDDSPSPTSRSENAHREESPLYVVESLIFDDMNRTSYVLLLPTLDRDEALSLSDAREFAEYAPADAIAGKLIVGSGESPAVTEYSVAEDFEWTEGDTLSFANFTSEPLDANLIVSDEESYVPFDSTNFVRWNPETFQILGEVGSPDALPLTRSADGEELVIWRGYGHLLRDALLFQPYYWTNAMFQHYAQESSISVIDTDADEVAEVLTAPCPHLHIADRDAAGNLTFSNGQGSIAAALLAPGHARNCFVTIPAGEDSLDAGSITYFRDLTDGREGSNFFYVDDDLAIFNVYHAERDDFGDDAEFREIDYSENYHLWTYDLKTKEARMMDGIGFSGGQIVAFRIDERLYLTIPAADYSRTEVWEVLPDGRAEKRFDVEGWAFKMFRLR